MKKYYVFLIPLFALALLVGCGQKTPPADEGAPAEDIMEPAPEEGAMEPAPEEPAPDDAMPEPAPDDAMPEPDPISFDGTLLSGMQTVVLQTSMGDVTLELDADSAPQTVTNFVLLGRSGYYNGLTFHRVIKDFMIQGGDPNGDGTGGESIYGPTFEDEVDNNPIPLVRSVIAMANRGPNTNGSQFFIVTRADGTPWLVGKHTGFGRVTEGMDIIDSISEVDTGELERPLEPITFDVEVLN
ncbi:MAG: peptidylprolyl isomerase [Candidatus Peregrinibacteria bacterium]